MKKRSYLIIFIILLIFLLTYNNLDFSKLTKRTPVINEKDNIITNDYTCPDCNVILIVIDTLRADHVGAYGYERDTTPNIDKLAEEGILFENMIAQSSWTKPSTASILTGLYPKNHGANTRKDRLVDEHLLLSEILKKEGYETHAFNANPSVSTSSGFNQGYDTFKELLYPDDYSDTINEKLIIFIKNLEKTSKQFIYVHYMDPHNPYLPREKQFAKLNSMDLNEKFFQDFFSIEISSKPLVDDEEELKVNKKISQQMINLYDDEILFNDKMVGQVLQALKEKKMHDNSIIIIVSDHGEEFLEHGSFLHGFTLYDEQLRVPWILWLPKKQHQVIEKQVRHIDMMPTILPLLDIPFSSSIDGINVLSGNQREKYSYAELNRAGYLFSSIQSLEEKLILGSIVSESPQKRKHWYDWFENQISFEVTGTQIKFPMLSFYKNQQIEVKLDHENVGRLELPREQNIFQLDLEESDESSIITLTALSPCKKVSELGLINDQRCFSFGIMNTSLEGDRSIQPIYNFFSLINDPEEQKNLFNDDTTQGRVEILESKLEEYIKKRKIRKNSEEPIEYTDEQLEALKALGYI